MIYLVSKSYERATTWCRRQDPPLNPRGREVRISTGDPLPFRGSVWQEGDRLVVESVPEPALPVFEELRIMGVPVRQWDDEIEVGYVRGDLVRPDDLAFIANIGAHVRETHPKWAEYDWIAVEGWGDQWAVKGIARRVEDRACGDLYLVLPERMTRSEVRVLIEQLEGGGHG